MQRAQRDLNENEISRHIVTAAIEVHRTLGGPGLLESVYEEALAWELKHVGCEVQRQKAVPVIYKGHALSTPLRLDMVINDKVIVECKATTDYNPIYESQALT